MVQFVAADFEVHLGAVDGAGAKIVEPDDDFFTTPRFHHKSRRHHHSGLAGHFLPLLPDLLLIEKDDSEVRQIMFFSEWGLTRDTAGQGKKQDPSCNASSHPVSDGILRSRHIRDRFLRLNTPVQPPRQ